MRGELYALAAATCWASASLIFTRLRADTSAVVLNALKCVIALALLVLTLIALEGVAWPQQMTSTQFAYLAISAVVGLSLGDTFYFLALSSIGPRRALLISATVPPITAVLGLILLGEPITLTMVAGMSLTVGGVIWVILERAADEPTASDQAEAGSTIGEEIPATTIAEDTREAPPAKIDPATSVGWGIVFALLFSVAQAVGNVLTKLGGEGLSALSISVVRLTVGTAGLLGFVLAMGRSGELIIPMRRPPTAGLIVIGTLVGTYLGIWFMMGGLQHTLVGVASTLAATSPIIVLPLVAIFFGERITPRAVMGAVIAVVGVAVLFQ